MTPPEPTPEVVSDHPSPTGAALTRDDVAHLAGLARIDMSDDELDRLVPQLSGILDAVATVSRLDVEGVEPMSHAVPLTNVFRADEVRPGLTPDEALSGAPAAYEQRFAVPRILGDEQ